MKKSLFLSMLAVSALVYSCKKNNDQSSIVGKWNLLTIYDNNTVSGVNHKDTTSYPSGSYTVEFTSNGKMYEKYNSFADTSTYKVEGSKLIVDTYDTLKINTLSASDLQLYSKEVSGSNTYETTINLKR